MNKYIRGFLSILGAALAASLLGAVFAVALAYLSPELVHDMFGQKSYPVRYSASIGMLWGLFIGGGAMAFCIGVAAIANWFRPRPKQDE